MARLYCQILTRIWKLSRHAPTLRVAADLIAHAQSAGPVRGDEGRGKWAESKEKRERREEARGNRREEKRGGEERRAEERRGEEE